MNPTNQPINISVQLGDEFSRFFHRMQGDLFAIEVMLVIIIAIGVFALIKHRL